METHTDRTQPTTTPVLLRNSEVNKFLFLGIQVRPVWSPLCLDSDWYLLPSVVVGSRPLSGLHQGRNEESCGVHIHFQQSDFRQRGQQRKTKQNTFRAGKR